MVVEAAAWVIVGAFGVATLILFAAILPAILRAVSAVVMIALVCWAVARFGQDLLVFGAVVAAFIGIGFLLEWALARFWRK